MIPCRISDRTGMSMMHVLLSVKIVFKPQPQRSRGSNKPKFEKQFVVRNIFESFFFFLICQIPVWSVELYMLAK